MPPLRDLSGLKFGRLTKMAASHALASTGPGLQAEDSSSLLFVLKFRLRDKHARELNRQAICGEGEFEGKWWDGGKYQDVWHVTHWLPLPGRVSPYPQRIKESPP